MKIIYIIISIAIAQVAGLIGSFFTIPSVNTWYVNLTKPLWNPPAWLFGPVWVTLYTLMGIAAYLIWQQRKGIETKRALIVYGLQLALNALWSILFFGLQNPGLAFLGIIVLLIFITITTIKFWKISTLAGILLLPYLVWVSFAAVLNYTIWQLN
jgi:translocator protein